jgi:two-component system invasion response regulator UvrY
MVRVPPVGDPRRVAGNSSAVDVLIVDDQRPFRMIARTVVGLVGGWRVTAEAETGEDALTAAEVTRPGVVLMDINLPGISGIEATRRILERDPDTTVVLMSTYAADDLPAEAASCGAVAYLHKEDLTPAALRALRAS